MAYPPSGSILNSEIHSGLSTQIRIKVGNNLVGAIQSLVVNQTRNIITSEEIGTDGIVESHPMRAAVVKLTVRRIVFDNLRLPEAFGRSYINLQAERFPFNIDVIDVSDSKEDNDAIIHVFHNCWFENYSTTIEANNFIIFESAGLTCERVTTSKKSQSAVNGGKRGLFYEYDTVERSTDVKGKIGRLI
jgi:hypothetical protein